MKQQPKNATPTTSTGRPASRPVFLFGVLLVAVAALVVALVRLTNSKSPNAEPVPNAEQPATADPNLPQLVERNTPTNTDSPALIQQTVAPAANFRPAPAVKARPEPSALTRQLVQNLFPPDQKSFALTPEGIAAWKQNFQELIQQGPSAVPAIVEFLDRFVDVGYGPEASRGLGFSSARAAMFDALRQIGGNEATEAMLGMLQTTGSPREMAVLSKYLEELAPEQHRSEILSAVRQRLSEQAPNPAAAKMDVGPLFEIVQRLGGDQAILDLEQATTRWNYYATLSLAQLPEGAGVPSLVRLMQGEDGKSGNLAALEMLGGMAGDSADARTALIEQVAANKIPANAWPYLTPVLAGDRFQILDPVFDSVTNPVMPNNAKTFHIVSGNQTYLSGPTASTSAPDWIRQQMQFIDELMTHATTPAALQALQQSKSLLTSRLQPATPTP